MTKGKRILTKFLLGIVFCFANILFIQAQSITITGDVYDKSGLTLPSVSILVQGTKQGTITDINGHFSITVKSMNDKLVLSYVGFTTLVVKPDNKNIMKIIMEEDTRNLSEVVVVGYGTQNRATVTGSINTLKNKEIVSVPTSNLSTAITGKLPGIVTIQPSGRPGEDAAAIFIRGQSTWVNTSPLIIVDGVERESFSQIDPNEIETISVLKDASSTAVYGVRGANGVILITTKRGEVGAPNISMSANFGFQQPTNIPKYLGSYQTLLLRKVATINDNKDPNNDGYLTDEMLEGFRQGLDPYRFPNVNWYSTVTKPYSMQDKYNVNIAGGTEKIKYFVSLGYLTQDGMFKFTDINPKYSSDTYYKQFNFRSNFDIKLDKYQTLSANISGLTGEKNGFPGVSSILQSLLSFEPYKTPIYNPDGTFATAQTGESTPLVRISSNGYDNTRTNQYDIVGVLKNDLSFITKGLTFDVNLSFNSSIGSMKSYREGANTYYYNPITLSYEQTSEASPLQYSGESTTSAYKRVGLQLKGMYVRRIGQTKLNSTLVYNQQNDQYGSAQPYVLKGYAARFEYDYSSKYLAEVNLGYNGSENFAPGHQFGFFPAFSAGYVLTEENFMTNLKSTLNFLKIRGSIGLVGNDKIGGSRFLWQGLYTQVSPVNPYLQYFGFGTTNPTSLGGIYEARNENLNLTWETALKRNIGIDLRMFRNNLLDITFDYFNEDRNDILMQARSMLNTTGIASPQYNIGAVKNYGCELEISHRNKIGELGYAIKGNYSFARNVIVNYDDPAGTPDYQKYAGSRIGQFRGYQVLGYFETAEEIQNSPNQATLGGPIIPGDLKYRDVNNDNQIDERDKVPIGYSTLPEIFYSISPEINWNGFTFSLMFQGAAHSSVFFTGNAGFEFGGSAGGGMITESQLNYWTPENKNPDYPSLHINPQHSNKNLNSFHLKSGDYLRLRNVQLSYTIPTKMCKKLNVSNILLSLSGYNLKTWSHINNFDPETLTQNGEIYPQQRIFNFGINVNI